MKKPTLLYVSPFWPAKSGISEYSEYLLKGLAELYDITLLTDDYSISSKELLACFHVKKYNSKENYRDSYDHILYNFGNNPEYHSYMYEMIERNPGYVILHEYVLFYLTVGYYKDKNLFQKIFELEGNSGIQIVKASLRKNKNKNLLDHKEIAALLPMNKEVLNAAKGIFVHSNYTKQQILKGDSTYTKEVNVIPFVKMMDLNGEEEKQKDFLRAYFHLEPDARIIASAGYIGKTKQNRLICEMVKKYNKMHKDPIYYVMIGQGNYVDDMLDKHIIKTGFLDNDEFKAALACVDLLFNLRKPYQGESSGPLIQSMSLGIPAVVSDVGWFSELPDDSVIKVSEDVTVDDLLKVMEDDMIWNRLHQIGVNAKRYVEAECDAKNIAWKIYDVMSMG